MIYASYTKLSKKLKNGIEIQAGQAVLELLIKKKKIFGLFLIHNLKNHLFKTSMPFLTFLRQFALRCILFFQKIKLIILR